MNQPEADETTPQPSDAPSASEPAAMSSVDSASFDYLEAGAGEGLEDLSIDMIQDIPVTLSMEVGRAEITIRNLLQLNQGSVVELDRTAGEPLDIHVNGTLVAKGEVVVVNERFGIRLTDVISPSERIRRLK